MPKTNGDMFRSMSNEDIASLAWEYMDCYLCPLNKPECERDCKGTWIDYLESEVSEDA